MNTVNDDYVKSFWWSMLLEFGEEVLTAKRKKLGLTQADIAVKVRMNQSEVSRIESGLAKPRDLPTIEAICLAYRLSPSEKSRYIEILTGYVPQNIIETEQIINNLLEGQIPFIAHTNRSGSPRIAIEQAELIMTWIDNQNVSLAKFNQNTLNKINHLLLEESAAWWDITPTQNIESRTKSQLVRMIKIAALSDAKETEAQSFLQVNLGFHSYIKHDYESATKYFTQVGTYKGAEKNPWALEILRANTIATAKLGDQHRLGLNEVKIMDKVSSSELSPQNRGYLLEGLGRAFLDFDLKKSHEYLQEAYKWIDIARNSSEFLNVRFVQNVRSNLMMMKKLGSSTSKLTKFAQPALVEAEKNGFVRHKNQILQIINSTT